MAAVASFHSPCQWQYPRDIGLRRLCLPSLQSTQIQIHSLQGAQAWQPQNTPVNRIIMQDMQVKSEPSRMTRRLKYLLGWLATFHPNYKLSGAISRYLLSGIGTFRHPQRSLMFCCKCSDDEHVSVEAGNPWWVKVCLGVPRGLRGDLNPESLGGQPAQKAEARKHHDS